MMTAIPATIDRALWRGLLVGPAAWSVHGLFGWFVGSRVCAGLMPPTARAAVAGVTIAGILAALWGASGSWRRWRDVTRSPGPLLTHAEDRVEFMALTGVFVSTIFAIAIFWGGWSSIFIGNCGRIR